MATAPKPAAPEIVGHVILVPANDIEIGDRLRAIDPLWAAALGRVMKVDGQKTPIEVCRLPGRTSWHLVAGGHRVIGARGEGIAYLKAIEVDNDVIERRLREISENLWRRDLDPLDRAAFVGDMHELLSARAGIAPDQSAQSIAANARWQKAVQADAIDASDIVSGAYGIAGQIADHLGLNERTIRRDLTLRRRLQPGELIALRETQHPVLRNGTQLLALAKLDDRDRAETVRLLVAGTVKTVAEATALRSQKVKPSPEAKALSAFIGSFARMGLPEKKGALAQLASLLTPSLIEALAEAIDLPKRTAPIAGPEVERALRTSSVLLGHLLEGSMPVSDEMIETAYNECEQALHRCGPAISNDELEEQP